MKKEKTNLEKPKKSKKSDSEHSFAMNFTLNLSKEQVAEFKKYGGARGFVYNLMLEEREIAYSQWKSGNHSEKVHFRQMDQSASLSLLKKMPEASFLREVPSQILQQACLDLHKSFESFFKGQKGYPKKHKKSISGYKFRFPDPKQFSLEFVNRNNAIIDLPKIGKVRFKTGGRKIPDSGRIRSCTIKGRPSGESWTISFNLGMPLEDFKENYTEKIKSHEDSSIGIDRGIKIAMQLSSGESFIFPDEEIKLIEKKIAKIQKALRKKKKFSKNWRKVQLKIGLLHTRISNIRQDWIHKTTTTIAKKHGFVVIENLKLKNMSKSASGSIEEPGKNVSQKSGLNRSLLRMGMGEQARQLEYKCNWYGSHLIKVDPKNSSRECHSCGHTEAGNRKNQSDFECLSCKLVMNADLNASKVILARGHRVSVCGEIVSGITSDGISLNISTKQKPLVLGNHKVA